MAAINGQNTPPAPRKRDNDSTPTNAVTCAVNDVFTDIADIADTLQSGTNNNYSNQLPHTLLLQKKDDGVAEVAINVADNEPSSDKKSYLITAMLVGIVSFAIMGLSIAGLHYHLTSSTSGNDWLALGAVGGGFLGFSLTPIGAVGLYRNWKVQHLCLHQKKSNDSV